MEKATNPYKRGTPKFYIWQDAYLAGKIDGSFEITMAHFGRKRWYGLENIRRKK